MAAMFVGDRTMASTLLAGTAAVLCGVVLKLAGRSIHCATLPTASTYWPPVIPRASVSTPSSIRSCARSSTSHATCPSMERWSVLASRFLL